MHTHAHANAELLDERALGWHRDRAAHFEPISTVRRLEVIDLLARDPEDPSHRRRHVFVKTVGELDDDYRTPARSTDKPPNDRSPRLRAELSKNDLHMGDNSTVGSASHHPTGENSAVSEPHR
jgi:hypothetical protein